MECVSVNPTLKTQAAFHLPAACDANIYSATLIKIRSRFPVYLNLELRFCLMYEESQGDQRTMNI